MSAFLDLHVPGEPLLIPNPWDAGSAVLLASLGFKALATTSSGYAASLGRLDGSVSRDELFAHCRTLVDAARVPVSADMEDGLGDDLAETVGLARAAGLAGGSIEDYDGSSVYPVDVAVARLGEAVAAAGDDFVITGRAENLFRRTGDLDDAIARLQAYEAAGAHVLYAPGIVALADHERVVSSVSAPVNALLLPGGPTVAELASVGIARISVGGSLAFAAYGAMVSAARTLLETGDATFHDLATTGRRAILTACDRGQV